MNSMFSVIDRNEGASLVKKDTMYLRTKKDIKVFSDPYRIKLLTVVKRIQPATVKQVADMVGDSPAKVHYHIKKFLDVGILRLHHTESINGIIAKYYETTAMSYVIDTSDENSDEALLESAEVTVKNCFAAISNQFIKDLQIHKNLDPETKEKLGDIDGVITEKRIYLTPEEYKNLKKKTMDWLEEKSQRTLPEQECYYVSISGVMSGDDYITKSEE